MKYTVTDKSVATSQFLGIKGFVFYLSSFIKKINIQEGFVDVQKQFEN